MRWDNGTIAAPSQTPARNRRAIDGTAGQQSMAKTQNRCHTLDSVSILLCLPPLLHTPLLRCICTRSLRSLTHHGTSAKLQQRGGACGGEEELAAVRLASCARLVCSPRQLVSPARLACSPRLLASPARLAYSPHVLASPARFACSPPGRLACSPRLLTSPARLVCSPRLLASCARLACSSRQLVSPARLACSSRQLVSPARFAHLTARLASSADHLGLSTASPALLGSPFSSASQLRPFHFLSSARFGTSLVFFALPYG